MTIRLALTIYFVLWLAWLVPWYFRRYHGKDRGDAAAGGSGGVGVHGQVETGSPRGRMFLYLLIWSAVIIAIATAWRVMHPEGS